MELALYAPDVGYYRNPERISAGGDYFTSPAAHPAFGALICIQLREMWQALGFPERFRVVEPGAGRGTLRRDVETYASRLDKHFADALDYVAVDRSAPASEPVPALAVDGCVVSNELLDAFPVHRFVIEAGMLRELYVSEEGGRIVEMPGEPSTPDLGRAMGSAVGDLPDGFRGEVNLRLGEYAALASYALGRGYVLTVDFGHPAAELYLPSRGAGTLRCYYRHTLTSDPLERIGEQDMAAHVDFTALDRAMSGEGFSPLGITSQREFLHRLGLREFTGRLRRERDTQYEIDSNRMAMLELGRPEGLGGFTVAVHGRGVAGTGLTGLDPSSDGSAAAGLPLPLLENEEAGRVPLLEGKYPPESRADAAWFESPTEADERARLGRSG